MLTIITFVNIFKFYPREGPNCGQRITIVGQWFGPLENSRRDISVGGVPCTNTAFVSITEVLCTTSPAHEAGGAIRVVTDTASGVSEFDYEVVPHPIITSIIPNRVASQRQTRITISGTFLGRSNADISSVTFVPDLEAGAGSTLTPASATPLLCGDVQLTQNATEIQCTVPPSTWGGWSAHIVIDTVSGCNNLELDNRNAIQMYAPDILSISPTALSLFVPTPLTIIGNDLRGGLTEISIDGRLCGSVVFASATSITCIAPPLDVELTSEEVLAAVGRVDVFVETKDGGISRYPLNMTTRVETPVVNSVSPVRIYTGQSSLVTLDGEWLGRHPGDLLNVTIAGIPCVSIAGLNTSAPAPNVTGAEEMSLANAWISPTQVTCLLNPSNETKPYAGPMYVETPYGQYKTDFLLALRKPPANPGTYLPEVLGVTPKTAAVNGPTVITISGIFDETRGPDGHIVTVSGLDCVVQNVTADAVTCVLEPGDSVGSFSVIVSTPFGEASEADVDFQWVPPPPYIEDCYPRLGRRQGGDNITLAGEFFLPAGQGTQEIFMGNIPCRLAASVDAGHAICTTVSEDELKIAGPMGNVSVTYVADTTPSGILFDLELQREDEWFESNVIDCGFQYANESQICEPACPRRANCGADAEGNAACICRNGWYGGDCSSRNIEVLARNSQSVLNEFMATQNELVAADRQYSIVVTEDTGFADGEILISLKEPNAEDVTVTFSIADPLGKPVDSRILLRPPSITIPASPDSIAQPVTVRVMGRYDAVRSGSVTGVVKVVSVTSADPRFASSSDIKPIRVLCLERSPRLYALDKTLIEKIGNNITVIASDLDRLVQITLDDNVVVPMDESKRRVLPDYSPERPSGLLGAVLGGRPVSREARDSSDEGAAGASRRRQSLAVTEAVTVYEELHLILPTMPNGYHSLSLVNLGGTMSTAKEVLYYTDSCTQEGFYGPDCKKCPVGGVCPGGDRVWAGEGYWTPSEDSAEVTKCEHAFRCPGGQGGAFCSEGYTGDFCAQCADQYYLGSAGECQACPSQTGVVSYMVADFVLWTSFGLAAAYVEDRELFTYCVVFVRALQAIAGIGETATVKTPQSARRIYEFLRLFSGDYSIVKADCLSPTPYHLQFYFALAHAVAIFIPMFVLLSLAKNVSKWRLRKAPDIEKRERMNYFHDRFVRCVLVAITLIYLTIGTRSLEAVACRPVNGELRMMASLITPCFKGKHMPAAAISLAFLTLVVAGFPAFLFYWYKRHPLRLYTNERFMEKYNFFYEQIRPGFVNFFLIEFYIFASLIAGKAVMTEHPNSQNALLSSGFAMKLMIIVLKSPYQLASDNWLQGVISLAALMATNYNFIVGLGMLDRLRGLSDMLVSVIFLMFAICVIVLVIYIGILMKREAKEVKAKREGMEYDLGDDWMVSMNEEFTYSFAQDSRVRKDRLVGFETILEDAVGVRPMDEATRELDDALAALQRATAERKTIIGGAKVFFANLFGFGADDSSAEYYPPYPTDVDEAGVDHEDESSTFNTEDMSLTEEEETPAMRKERLKREKANAKQAKKDAKEAKKRKKRLTSIIGEKEGFFAEVDKNEASAWSKKFSKRKQALHDSIKQADENKRLAAEHARLAEIEKGREVAITDQFLGFFGVGGRRPPLAQESAALDSGDESDSSHEGETHHDDATSYRDDATSHPDDATSYRGEVEYEHDEEEEHDYSEGSAASASSASVSSSASE